MTYSYQNLDDGVPKRFWSYGRVWLRRSGERWNRRCGTLRLEWNVPAGSCGWGVTVGGGDAGRDFQITVSIPFLLTVYVTLENVFPVYAFGTDFNRGHDRDISVRFFAGAIWWSVWVGTMASWSRDYPWCRWWRQGSFHFADLLGTQRYTRETIEAERPITIPMPEGIYHAVAKVERQTWKRPLGFTTTRIFVDVTIPKGIPHAGKGENSWDCGDDGLFGYGSDGPSIEKAIGHGVEIVLTARRRYGQSSPEAIQTALA